MNIEEHIKNLLSTPSDREQERAEQWASIQEMETTLYAFIVEVGDSYVIITK